MIQASSGTSHLRLEQPNIVLTGPPGSGKSTVGHQLGLRLKREFVDTDALVEEMSGKSIASIFELEGEAAFRQLEAEACRRIAAPAGRVVACGGGALLSDNHRALLKAGGQLVCLTAEPEVLLKRMGANGRRPLLQGDHPGKRLEALLAERREAYASIPVQIDTTRLATEQAADQIARLPLALAEYRLTAQQPRPGYEVLIGNDLFPGLASSLADADLAAPYILVSDENVAPHYEGDVREALNCTTVVIPAGEQVKSQEALTSLYDAFVEAGLDRSGTVLALGGGVLLDLAGFAAATFMRGVKWAALPTSLLAMVDASLGGKVGINLPAGKNLDGAFHTPSIVLADLATLDTLPAPEIKTGLAEMIKAALIGDADLFARMETGPAWISREWILRSIEVKLKVVDSDPWESGGRAALNLGHTFAHALEVTSDYRLSHGQAVSVGLVAAARLASAMGRCDPRLVDRVQHVLERFDLPVTYKDLRPDLVLGAMARDKKKIAGRVRFVLPTEPGQVEFGVEAPEELVREILDGLK